MHTIIAILLLGISVSPVVAGPNSCDAGPKYWCKSYETATECGVLAWCKLKWQQDAEHAAEPTFPTTPSVNVTLYFEVLCGGCRQWILNTGYPVFEKLLGTGVLSLELVPYGNAHVMIDGTVQCQHGPAECYGNTIESCAIHCLKDAKVWFPFVRCMESMHVFTDAAAEGCANTLKIDYKPIRECVNGPEGKALIQKNKARTDALVPRHNYVPWLTMNGVHNDDVQDGLTFNMLKYVCDAYKGTKPAACHEGNESKRCYKK